MQIPLLEKLLLDWFKIQKVQNFWNEIAWARLIKKDAAHTAPFLTYLKSEFHDSKLDPFEEDPEKWISYLERLKIWMSKFRIKSNITDEDFMIHILNNWPKEYNVT